MRFTQYQGAEDRDRMLGLVWDHPAQNTHVIDLPYRLCSWAFEDPSNVGLWVDGGGALVGWAVMQAPFWMIDFATRNEPPPELLRLLLGWADQKANAMLGTKYGRPSWFVSVRESDDSARYAIEKAGFTSQETTEEPWTQLSMAVDGDVELPPCAVKQGFTLRLLRGESEVPAYVALHRSVFGTSNMTESWRLRTLLHPEYRPDLDMVIEDQAGALVAFCISWLAKLPGSDNTRASTYYGQIEPIGVCERGRRHGLAWSIIAEAIRRMRDMGAEKIFVHSDNNRDRAFVFYQSVGFQTRERILIYRKDYE